MSNSTINQQAQDYILKPFEAKTTTVSAPKSKRAFQPFESGVQVGGRLSFELGGGFSFPLFEKSNQELDKEEADRFIEEVKENVISIEKEALLKGLKEGRTTAISDVRQEAESLIASLKESLHQVEKVKLDSFSQFREEMVNMIFSITRKVIHREVDVQRDVVTDVIKWAVQQLMDKDEITIKLNPEDVEVAGRFQEDLRRKVEGLKGIAIEGDTSITKGGCMIETSFGSVDARIEPQMLEIEKALRKSIENSSETDKSEGDLE